MRLGLTEKQGKTKQGKARKNKAWQRQGEKKKKKEEAKQYKKGKDETGCHYVRTYGSTNQPY